MVARPGTYQASNNAGELAPEVHGRTDLKQFFAGLATALNIEPVPQGGSKLSMRTRHLGRIRKLLAAIALTGSTVPAGSYVAGAVLATATFVASNVSVVKLPGWAASQLLGAILQVEYFSGGNYLAFGAPFTLGVDAGTLAVALPPRQSVNTTAVRVRMVSAPPSSTSFTASALVVLTETATKANARARPFTFSLTQTYVAVMMDHVVDFYRDGVWVGASATGFAESQLATLDTPQRLDTMLLFQSSTKSQRILRDGADTKWLLSDIPFENIPLADLGGSYGNQLVDTWEMYIRYPSADSDFVGGADVAVTLSVNGENTAVVTGSHTPDWVAFAGNLKAAIEAVSTVGPGTTVTSTTSLVGSVKFTIQFTGATNLGKSNSLSAQVVNTADCAATMTHTQTGDPGGEDLFSVSRGYAACGNFYQDRLLTGGFNAKRSAWLASATGEYFDLNTKFTGASGAILANIDTDGAEQLQRIVRDKYLLLFTSDGEYFVADRTLDRTKPPTIVNSSRYGSAADLPVIANEGEIIFASHNKSVLYAASYDEVATSYVSAPMSLLASHIVNGMTDMALQRPSGVTNAARLWMPREDGSATVGVMLRNQDVTSFVRWQTPGLVKSACVDGKNAPHLLVERTVAGATEIHLERLEDGLIFDDVVEQSFDPPQAIVTGLAVHEGAEVWAETDGYVEGPFTVASGQITLDFAAANVRVGRWTPPLAKTLPLPSEVAERTVLRRPKRVHTVRIDLVDTTSVAVGANDRPARNVALSRISDDVDAPQAPVNRTEVITGLTGFSDTGQVTVTQIRPGHLAWRGIVIEARS
jgi:hypothetical protein